VLLQQNQALSTGLLSLRQVGPQLHELFMSACGFYLATFKCQHNLATTSAISLMDKVYCKVDADYGVID
jgi:hypothetical protein